MLLFPSLSHISFQISRRLDSTNFHVKLYFGASLSFKCSILYCNEEQKKIRRRENARLSRPVGLLSSRRETYFYLPRNKDKSETRTNDIRDRSFQPKRSARQVHIFVPRISSQGYTMHETSPLKFRLSTRFLLSAFPNDYLFSSLFPLSVVTDRNIRIT